MTIFKLKTSARFGALALAVLGLAACNDNQGTTALLPPASAPVAMTTISGVAAVGAAISGGAVLLRCGGGLAASTTTATNGGWTSSVPTAALPCAVKVSGGTPAGTFYSMARAASGTASAANLTPVADLALAAAVNSAVGTALEAWFASATDAQRQQVASGLAAAISSLRTALANAGYTLPTGSFDPFTATIVAGASGDGYDQLLEAYRQALTDAGTTYEAARGNYTAGAGVPAPTVTPPDNGEVSGPLTAPASANATAFLANLAGDYQLLVDDAYAAGEAEFPKGSVHTVQIKADGTVSIRAATKTLTYVYAQKTLSDYSQENAGTATEKDILRFYAASGGSLDLYITYEPGVGYLTITPQGFTGDSEGGATLVSKKGTPATPAPTTPPPTVAGKGILGAALHTVFAGDYVLKCSTFGQPVQTFALSIAPDGSSVFNGAPLVDASHPGRIKTEGVLSSSITLKIEAAARDSAYVLLGWRADGSFVPNSVYVPGEPYGQTLSCFANTGNTAPAATTRALQTVPQAVAALARSETLSCRQGSTTAPQTFTVNSDGSSQLGSQAFAADQIFAIDDSILFGSNKSGTVQYSDITSEASRTLSLAVDADLKTTGVLASVGSGPNDVIICTP